MESKKEVMHTPEPWRFRINGVASSHFEAEICDSRGIHTAYTFNPEDARRIVACVNELAGKPEGYVQTLEQQRDQAVRALKSAGYTLNDGAQEWKPPTGPSASPLLDLLDATRTQCDELLAALKHLVYEEGNRYFVGWRDDTDVTEYVSEAIAKCEVQS